MAIKYQIQHGAVSGPAVCACVCSLGFARSFSCSFVAGLKSPGPLSARRLGSRNNVVLYD